MMSNYYEMLGLATDANTADIHRAVDKRYNEMRQLATHPDAAVVEQANRGLRQLEQMRTTLTDPTRREVYNAGIGIGGAGGLIDPAAILRHATPAPPPPRVTMPAPAPANVAPDLWVCPKCSTRNPEWTQFCLNCQNELMRLCPECGQMKSLVKTGVCGNCGFSFDAGTRRVALMAEINSERERISAHQVTITGMTQEMQHRRENMTNAIFFTVVLALLCAFLAIDFNRLVMILLVFITSAGGVFIVSRDRAAARALELNIATEQEAVAQVQRQIQGLEEEHARLGARKRL